MNGTHTLLIVLMSVSLLACDTLIHYKVYLRTSFGASPSRGRPPRLGKALAPLRRLDTME